LLSRFSKSSIWRNSRIPYKYLSSDGEALALTLIALSW
jgi:hypothetical protein